MEVEGFVLPLGRRAFVCVKTRNGQPVYLLNGHPPHVLRALVRDLKQALWPAKRKPTSTSSLA
jgi:hypothetical protein